MNQNKLAREERLAAKLRENLRRRKVQARAQTDRGEPETVQPATEADQTFSSSESRDDSPLAAKTEAEAHDIDSPALPKAAPES